MEMDHQALLKNFLDEQGRLKAFPAKRKLQLCAVEYLAAKLEPGQYTEREINDLLRRWHTFNDPETLRRELYEGRFLNRTRDGSVYWVEEREGQSEE